MASNIRSYHLRLQYFEYAVFFLEQYAIYTKGHLKGCYSTSFKKQLSKFSANSSNGILLLAEPSSLQLMHIETKKDIDEMAAIQLQTLLHQYA